MAKKNTARRASTPWLKTVTTKDGRTVRNECYDPKAKAPSGKGIKVGRTNNVMEDIFGPRETEQLKDYEAQDYLEGRYIKNGGPVRMYGTISTGEKVALYHPDDLRRNGHVSDIELKGPKGDIDELKQNIELDNEMVDTAQDRSSEIIGDMDPSSLSSEFDRHRAFTGEGFDIAARMLSEDEIVDSSERRLKIAWAGATQSYATESYYYHEDVADELGVGEEFPSDVADRVLNDPTETQLKSRLLKRKDELEAESK